MASRTKPLISAAALASAAAIAVATPALSPNLGVPTPAALSKAAYQLTTLSDVLSIPPVVWTDLLFGNTDWGGTLSTETYGPDWAAPTDALGQPGYVNPWVVYCDGGCTRTGIAGVSYLFLDALVNGTGNGWQDGDGPNDWPIGFVNYFAEPNGFFPIGSGGGSSPAFQFENLGYSAAAWYLLQGSLGQAVPELTVPIASLFWGLTNTTVGYNLALSTVAGLLQAVPLVGPLAGNSILAYLGDLPVDPENPSLGFYQYGLSGALNYWIDIATGAVPFPGGAPNPLPLLAAAEVAEADTAKVVPAAVVDSAPVVDVPASSPIVEAPVVGAPAVEVAVEAPAVEVTDEAPAVEAPAVEVAVEAPTVEVGEIPAADTEPAVAPEAPEVTVPDIDIDLKDLDVAEDAPAEAPKSLKGSLDDAADSVSSPAVGESKADAGSAGAGASDSSDAGDSAGSDDKGDSDS